MFYRADRTLDGLWEVVLSGPERRIPLEHIQELSSSNSKMASDMPTCTFRHPLKAFREAAFVIYSARILKRHSRQFSGQLCIGDATYAIEAVEPQQTDDVERFLCEQLTDEDRAFAGFKTASVNLSNRCAGYFTIRNADDIAAVFLVQSNARDTVENYIAVGKSFRRRQLLNHISDRHQSVCGELGLSRTVRLNRHNEIMCARYRKRGFVLNDVVGDCYVLKIKP